MRRYKRHEQETIQLYESVDLFPPKSVIPNSDSDYEDDFICATDPSTRYESKLCFSTFHHPELYDMGYDANEIAYIRMDQLQRYQEEDEQTPELKRVIILDCRIIDLSCSAICRVNSFISRTSKFYEVQKRWTITLTTTKELEKISSITLTSRVPLYRRNAYCNNPNWDGWLLNIPTSELKTYNVTKAIPMVGEGVLLAARE